MRRNRRGGGSGLEFGGSGEDSFVAVVVTKLTGRLAVHPAADDGDHGPLAQGGGPGAPGARTRRRERTAAAAPLAITTPETLPEAIAGRPYALALAATGGRGPLRWTLDGTLPEGPDLRSRRRASSRARRGRGRPSRCAGGPGQRRDRDRHPADPAPRLPERPAADDPRLVEARHPAGPLAGLARQGVGFLVLWLVHLVGMSTLANLEQRRGGETACGRGRRGRRHWSSTGASRLTASSYGSARYRRCWLSAAWLWAGTLNASDAGFGLARLARPLAEMFETVRKDSWPPLAGKPLRWWREPDKGRRPVQRPSRLRSPSATVPRSTAMSRIRVTLIMAGLVVALAALALTRMHSNTREGVAAAAGKAGAVDAAGPADPAAPAACGAAPADPAATCCMLAGNEAVQKELKLTDTPEGPGQEDLRRFEHEAARACSRTSASRPTRPRTRPPRKPRPRRPTDSRSTPPSMPAARASAIPWSTALNSRGYQPQIYGGQPARRPGRRSSRPSRPRPRHAAMPCRRRAGR